MKHNIALVAGGFSKEAAVSIRSADIVEKNLDTELFNTYKIIIYKDDWYYANDKSIKVDKNDFSIIVNDQKITFDVAFIIIHGTPGEDGKLQGYFDMLEIPYTTCDSISSALTFNKAFCSKVVAETKIVNIAKSLHLFSIDDTSVDNIINTVGLPLFVKPNAGGSSIGMSKVSMKDDLYGALEKAFKEDSQVLVEQFIKGREFTRGIFKANEKKTILPTTEIISKTDFFDYEAKYDPKLSEEITPAEIDETLDKKLFNICNKIYDILNCSGIVRIDFILEEKTKDLYFLEINTVPGQSAESIIPKQIRAIGMSTKDVYTKLINDKLKLL